MAGAVVRLAIAAALTGSLAGGLAGCASDSGEFQGRNIPEEARDSAVVTPDAPLQCVPYAREHSGIALYGDAYTWWDQAAGRFARGTAPQPGAVLVLAGYAGPNRAHLAVVHDILSPREIRVDHANWLDDGAIYTNDPVVDVSPANDWSAVRVWNVRAEAWGVRTYPVQGFIGPGPGISTDRVARNDVSPQTETDNPTNSVAGDEAGDASEANR